MKRLQKGFTLIELLVVIAILGILAAVVLINVNSARNRAREAAIISALAQIRSDKEVNFTTSYQTVGGQVLTTISSNGGSSPLIENNTITSYMVASVLPTGGFYCVDSKGASRKVTTAPLASMSECPAS